MISFSSNHGRTLTVEDVEGKIAAAVGLPPWTLTAEEQIILPDNIEKIVYLVIRNHLLTKWRKNPRKYLNLESAGKMILKPNLSLAAYAWKFLDHFGYINFGVGNLVNRELSSQPTDRGSIIIIGAGLAGLAASRQLRMKGYRVIVLEARHRIGGRVHSEFTRIEDKQVVVELGGSVINGVEGNPLAVLAAQLQLPLHKISNQSPLHFPDGRVVPDPLDQQCEKKYNALLDSCGGARELLGPASGFISLGDALELAWKESKLSLSAQERMLINWHFANLEFANSCKLETLSLGNWDQDDPYELPGDHAFLPGGNIQLINALARGTDILLNQVVTKVRYATNGVEVQTPQTIYKGDAVLVTVPLGVLKRKKIAFHPPLSLKKQTAIKNLGYGVLNKAILWFPSCFWKEKGDVFGYVNQNSKQRGNYFLFYSYADISGGNVLAALVSGQAAEEFELRDEEIIVKEIMQILSNIFNPSGIHGRNHHIPYPIKTYCTRWGKDPFSFGSYSSIAVGHGSCEDYEILAENLGQKVFFAGEATSQKYPATMHGAFLTGLREAANISAVVNTN